MSLQPFRRPQPGEHPRITPEMWKLLDPILKQVEAVTNEIRNTNKETRTLSMQQGVTQEVQLQSVRGVAKTVRVLSTTYSETPRLDWSVVDEKHINVSAYWDTAPTEATDVTIEVEGD